MKPLLILLLIVLTAAAAIPPEPTYQSFVLTNVTVIDMTSGQSKPDQTVEIQGNRIVRVSKSSEVLTSFHSEIVDGTGKFLIPGLWDMHAHTVYDRARDTERTLFKLFVANGVTGIRNLGSINSLEQIKSWRTLAANYKLVSPRIVIGQQIDGPGDTNVSFVYRVRNASEARSAVQRIKREGFDFVKVHGRLSREAYLAVADEARKLGITFAGHVPLSVTDGEASDAGQRSIEHLEGMLVSTSSEETEIRQKWMEYEAKVAALSGRPIPPELAEQEFRFLTDGMNTHDATKADRLYLRFAKNETYHCPTLIIHRAWGSLSNPNFFRDPNLRYVPSKQRQSVNTYINAAGSWSAERKLIAERLYKFRLRMVSEMHRAGVPLLAGTDTAYGYPVAGFALHDELSLLVQAGLTPIEALRTATYNPAKFLGMLDSLGTVEKGKIADLVLLDANPLEDIKNARRISAVILDGRYFSKEALTKILAEAEAAAN